jgi:hypothetical protein
LFNDLGSYSCFACGGTVSIRDKEKPYPWEKPTEVVHHLQVLKDGHTVASWPLSSVPVEDLLQYCTTAAFGDLTTQTTVFDPAVRSAVELLAVPDPLWPHTRTGTYCQIIEHLPIFSSSFVLLSVSLSCSWYK